MSWRPKPMYIFSQCSKLNHKSKCRSISKLFDGKIKLLEQNCCEKSGVRINMIDTVYWPRSPFRKHSSDSITHVFSASGRKARHQNSSVDLLLFGFVDLLGKLFLNLFCNEKYFLDDVSLCCDQWWILRIKLSVRTGYLLSLYKHAGRPTFFSFEA